MIYNDLQWIYYSLLSLKKFVKGIKEIIIYCHDVCCGELYELINKINLECRIIPVHYDYHGYLKQMVIKADCFKDINTKYVVIVDSDNIFTSEFNINDLIEPSGKIKWFYCRTNSLRACEKVWKTAYESMTKTEQNVGYMVNGHPFVFTTKSLCEAAIKFQEIHNIDYNTFCHNGCIKYNITIDAIIQSRFVDLSKVFTEFEWLGYYCHNFSDDYIFISSEFKNSSNKKLKQFWSHGGITLDIKNQIEKILQN
jgi:hypothetical protein